MTTLSDLEYEPSTINVHPDDPDVHRMPRLMRFYGISFQELWKLPRWLLVMLDEQVEKLTAQEQLLQMQVADFPHIPQKDRQRIHRDMLKHAGLYKDAPAIRPQDQGDIRKLAGMGIGVKFEPPKPKPAAAAEEVMLDA